MITDRLRPIRAHAASPQGTQTGIKPADLRETPIPNHEQKGSMGGLNITLVSLSTGRRSALQERPLPQCAHCGTRLLQLEFGVQPPIQAGFGGVGATVSVGRSTPRRERKGDGAVTEREGAFVPMGTGSQPRNERPSLCRLRREKNAVNRTAQHRVAS